jgi:hypothetical protein
MKFIMVLSLLALTGACNANSPVIKNKEDVAAVKKEQLKAEDKKEEDCDDKAKKPIEIKEDTISLTGNTGCSLDEVTP